MADLAAAFAAAHADSQVLQEVVEPTVQRIGGAVAENNTSESTIDVDPVLDGAHRAKVTEVVVVAVRGL